MSTIYAYSIANDTANGIENLDRLEYEVKIAIAAQVPTAINSGTADPATGQSRPDLLQIEYATALSGADETTLDAIIAAHSGAPVPSVDVYLAKSFCPAGEWINVVAPDWVTLDVAGSRPDFWKSPQYMLIQLYLYAKVTGSGAAIRARDYVTDAVIVPETAIGDTGSGDVLVNLKSAPGAIGAGHRRVRIEMKSGAATLQIQSAQSVLMGLSL